MIQEMRETDPLSNRRMEPELVSKELSRDDSEVYGAVRPFVKVPYRQ